MHERLDDKSVDVVVTSPPYNLKIKYRRYSDNKKRTEYIAWAMQWGAEIKRVLKDNGSFFLNFSGSPAKRILPHLIAIAFSDLFVLQNEFHWVKSITVTGRDGQPLSTGHFKPINSSRYVNDCHEYLFHFTKTGRVHLDRLAIGVPYADKSNIKRWSGKADIRCRGNTLFIPYETIQSRKSRPQAATFPPALPRTCIKLHGVRKDLVVLDPFMGIGNTAIAAKDCGAAKCIGFEIDEESVKEARLKTCS